MCETQILKKGVIAIIIGVLIAVFSSCDNSDVTQSVAAVEECTFHAQEVSLPENICAVDSVSKIDEENVLLLAEVTQGTAVIRLDIASEQCWTLYLTQGSERISAVAAIPEKLDFWCIVETSDGAVVLRHINSQGEVTVEIPIFDENTTCGIYGVQASSMGNVYLYWKNSQNKNYTEAGIYGYSSGGHKCLDIHDIDTDGFLIQTNTSEPVYIEQHRNVYDIDIEKAELQEQFSLYAECTTPFYMADDVVLGATDQGIENYSSGGISSVFSFSNIGLYEEAYIGSFVPLKDDAYLSVINATLYTVEQGVAPAEEDSRKVVSIGTLGISPVLAEAVSQFNSENEEYRAKLVDYSSYGSDGDLSTALNLFQTELMTGGGPDVIAFGVGGNSDLTGIDANKLAAQGLLEDLYSYLSSDPELSPESFYSGLMSALESDGKLYQLPSGFYIRSVIGSADIVGNQEGWRFSDMLEAASNMPNLQYTFGSTISRDRLMQLLLAFNNESYIDYQAGECFFDSNEFIEMLEFMKSCYTSENGEREIPAYAVAAGRQMLGVVTVGTIVETQEYEAIFPNSIYVGMPTTKGNGTAFSLTNSFGINVNAENQEGAWAFLRTIYLNNAYDGFPSNTTLLDAYFAAPEKYDPYDMTVGYEDEVGNNWEFAFSLPTAEDVQRVKNLIALADRIYQPDDDIATIVQEEAAAYFAGEKTVEEVAAIIQNRVKIYINEQLKDET